MLVMPANSTGWFWHSLARETSTIGHLYSPDAQTGPWPWFPYALDCGAFSCWDMKKNEFNYDKWATVEPKWRALIYWAKTATQQPLWAIAPDIPGNALQTILRWTRYAGYLVANGITPAVAVQDGMTVADVKALLPEPKVICIGGSTEWKWSTVEMWASNFNRVHVLRCNSPTKLDYLKELGVESCDGTGWNRGNKTQTVGLEQWARRNGTNEFTQIPLHTYTCRGKVKKDVQKQLEWQWFETIS